MGASLILGGPPFQARQVQPLVECFLSLLNWHLNSLDPLHFIQLLPYLGYVICSHGSSDLESLISGDQSSSQILHYDHSSLIPHTHLSIGIHDAQTYEESSFHPPPPPGSASLHACCCPETYSVWGVWSLTKSINFFPLCCLDSLIQVIWIHSLICSCLIPKGELCSVTCLQVGYAQPIQGNWQFIYLTLFDHVYNSIDGWCVQYDWHMGSTVSWSWNDQGHFIFIEAPGSRHLNPYDNVAQGLGE